MFDETVAQLEPTSECERRPRTILVVDDDKAQLVFLEHRLQKQGYRVLTAATGRVACERALDERPDLILLDLRLPDLDGFQVCSQLADDPRTCAVPIIILSALERPNIVRQSRAVGGAYYLRKPYDPNVLLTLIEQSLQDDADAQW
jgi:CheY-like chemotaxis protein